MTRLSGVTHRDPHILSGVPVFVGTRVPVRSLFDYLEGGDTLEEFLHQFPAVKREQAIVINIKVEQPVTRLPPHKSRRAELPHRAFQNCSLCTHTTTS